MSLRLIKNIFVGIFAVGLAQSVDCLTAEREVAGLTPRAKSILRVLKQLRNEGILPLCCKWPGLCMAQMTT